MATCPACGATHPAGALFCPACGAALAPTCPTCGAETAPGAAFCTRCGSALTDQGSDAATHVTLPSASERKIVTVLFADLAGSTGMAERLDPEATADVLRTYFEAMRAEAESEGGSVEKFIGDAVMAVFGVPIVHEDDPERAVRAGLAMQARLDEVNARLARAYDVKLALRVGVNTGSVLATLDATPGEAMVTGDVVNVAARLQAAAEPGEVLVSERTARVARCFSYADRGGLELKGKREPVRAFSVTGASSTPVRGLADLRAPMVGRASELAALSSVLDRSTRERQPHLVTVYGEPGVGKSRLLREFVEQTRLEEPAPLVMHGRCLPYGDGITYWPLAEILKGYALVRDSDPPDVAIARIRSAVADLLTDGGEHPSPVETAAALAYTLGLADPEVPLPASDPLLVRRRLHAAWQTFFSAAAGRGPLLVVIEDIHWADPALLDLLEEMEERVQGPAVIACTSRPDLVTSRPTWGGGRRNAMSVALQRLDDSQADALVRLLLDIDDLPLSLHRRILERAEGNPFFIEEILRRFVDEGIVVRDGGRWRAMPNVDKVEIPDSVQGVLAARIDLLSPADKRVLQAAAVVGRVFWTEPLNLLVGDAAESTGALGRLEERDLVQFRLGSSLAGQSEYIFKHILTRDVAYGSIPRRERSAAHAVVARWVERTTADRAGEFSELLAHHYATAVALGREAGGQVDEDLRASAWSWLLRASVDARCRFVVRRARRLAQEALELSVGDVERCQSLAALGEACGADSLGDESWKYLREAALVADASPDISDLQAAELMGLACERAVRWPGTMRVPPPEADVRELRDRGLQLVPSGDVRERAQLLAILSGWPFAYPETVDEAELGAYREAGLEAADIAQRLGDVDLESGVLDQAAAADTYQGYYGTVVQTWQRRFALRDRLSADLEIGDLYAMGAWIHFELSRYDESVDYALAVVDRTQEPSGGMHALAWEATSLFRLGRWDGALASFRTLRDQLDDRRDAPPGFAMHAFGMAALILRVRGDRVESDEIAAMIDTSRAPTGVRAYPWRIWLLLSRRDVAGAQDRLETPPRSWKTHAGLVHEARCDTVLAAGDWDEAPETAARVRAYALEAPAPSTEAFADRLDGAAALARGDVDGSIALLERAVRGFDGCSAVWERARTQLLLEVALRQAGRAGEADEVRADASLVLERLGVVDDAVIDMVTTALTSL